MRFGARSLVVVVVSATLGCAATTQQPDVETAETSTTGVPASATLSSASTTPGDDILTGQDDGPTQRPTVPAAPTLEDAYRFLSAPDFMNQDVADLTTGGRQSFIDPTTGRVANSINDAYAAGLQHVLGEMASHDTSDLVVAGDMVEGRWGRDDSRSGVFGPVGNDRERMAATREAAGVYYPAWRQRLASHGLRAFPAVGDHEIGDDPWRERGNAWITFKRRHEPEFKSLFVRHLLRRADGADRFANRPTSGQARETAYAVRLDENVLLVTLDVFTRRHGQVRPRVDKGQLTWLKGVLRRARRADIPWVIVQGHTPITGPVRYRNSSHLSYVGGTRSPLWQTMVEGGVDVYLNGEVHDQSVAVTDGIVQVAHGTLFYRGEMSYVVAQTTADDLVLENRQFRGTISFEDRLWTTSRLGAPGQVAYPDPSDVTGTLTAHRTDDGGIEIDEAAGVLRPLR